MEATLVVIRGKANKSRVRVRLPSVVGRSREADLRVAHPMVSRQHCQLYEENGLLKVRDLGSLNGVFVAGEKVADAVVPPNGVFSIGPLSFRAEYEYVERAVPPQEVGPYQEGGPGPSEQGALETIGGDQAEAAVPGKETELAIAPEDGAIPDFGALPDPAAGTFRPTETVPEAEGSPGWDDDPSPLATRPVGPGWAPDEERPEGESAGAVPPESADQEREAEGPYPEGLR